jgi:hypothetical protein
MKAQVQQLMFLWTTSNHPMKNKLMKVDGAAKWLSGCPGFTTHGDFIAHGECM